MCAALSPIPSRPLSGEKFRFSSRQSRASMRCLCRPGRVCFFFFCFSLVSLHHLSEPSETSFLATGVGRCSPIRSQLAHTAPTGPVTRLADVVPLLRPLTGHKSPHRAEFGFSCQNELTPPPKGGGAGYRLSWVGRVTLLVHNGATAAQQGWSGASLVSFPYLAFKIAHRATQGRVCIYFRFPPAFPGGK